MSSSNSAINPDCAVVFFDLDGTLIDCNSARLWMLAEWRAGRMGLQDSLWGSWWLMRYHFGVEDGLDRAFEQAAYTLKGLTEPTLVARTTRWFRAEVEPRLRPGARAAIAQAKQHRARCVLATSASVYEARCAAAAWGLETGVHTEFEVQDGVFTGNISQWALGAHKREAMRAWGDRHGISLATTAFCTDSYTDLPALEAVGHPVVVHPDRKLAATAAERNWPVVDWDTDKE